MENKKRKNHYCVVCRTDTDLTGIIAEGGSFICLDCAELIYHRMEQFHGRHLNHCTCCNRN